jgi:hypothetical protein
MCFRVSLSLILGIFAICALPSLFEIDVVALITADLRPARTSSIATVALMNVGLEPLSLEPASDRDGRGDPS